MKKVLLLMCIILCGLSVQAVENVLQGIQIEPVKDTYNVLLSADSVVDVKKTIESPNKITLELKGIRASKTLSTVYDNVPDVDSVIIEPLGDNGITIFFQADNAEKSTISFDTVTNPIAQAKSVKRPDPSKEILLSKPIKSFSPVYDESEEFSETEFSSNFLSGVIHLVKSALMDDKINQIITFGLMGIIFLFGVKLIRRKDNDISVGLSQSLKDREINFYKNMQPVAPAITPLVEKPFVSSYGVKAYRNTGKNPYDTETKETPINPVRRMQHNVVNKRVVTLPEKPQELRQPSANVATKPSLTNSQRIENVKFLETMSAIYEKSGRHDLAQGIRTSIQKATKP